MDTKSRLTRPQNNKLLGGVCAGIAEYFNINVTLLRVIWLVFGFCYGAGIVLYLIFLIVLPPSGEEKSSVQIPRFGLFLGILLVLIGFMSLLNGYWPVPFFYTPAWLAFFTVRWDYLWPILLICFGGMIILAAFKQSAGTKLFRSENDKKLTGVCAGLARYWNIDVSLIRVGFIAFTLLTHLFIGIAVYLILSLILPQADTEIKNEWGSGKEPA